MNPTKTGVKPQIRNQAIYYNKNVINSKINSLTDNNKIVFFINA